jgi:ribose transport system permease protein
MTSLNRGPSGRRNLLEGNTEIIILLAAFALLCLVLSLLSDRFMTWSNAINVWRQVSINLLLACGMTFVILSGGLDLSAGALVSLTGCITAVLLTKAGAGMAVSAGLLTGVAAGLLVGALVAYGNIPPFVASLGAGTMWRGLALIVTGGDIITGLPEPFLWLGGGFIGPIPVPVVIAAVVLAIGYLLLHHTPFGLHVYALGGNAEAARLSGVKNQRIILTVYSLMGFLAALAGVVLTARVQSGQPALGTGMELTAIASVIIGGSNFRGEGRMLGTLIGTLFIGVLGNGLNILNINYFWQQVVIGAVIIIAVLMDKVRHARA